MQVQRNSFINNFKLPEQRICSGQTFTATTPDSFESSNKKDNTKKYVLIGLGLAAVAVALVKHKQIGEFFNKLSTQKVKSGETIKPPTELPKPPVIEKPPVVQPKPKFELPKPEFKFDETNPVEFKKEKDTYLTKIIYYARQDENVAHDVMEQFKNYGSHEHLMDLATSLSLSKNKTDNMVQDYIKLYQKHGVLDVPEDSNTCDATLLRFILNEFQEVISKDSMVLITKEFKRTGKDAGALTEVRSFLESKEQNPFLKKFSDSELSEIRQFAQDAEEVVQKRVYQDN